MFQFKNEIWTIVVLNKLKQNIMEHTMTEEEKFQAYVEAEYKIFIENINFVNKLLEGK